jgi:hypothetical protein
MHYAHGKQQGKQQSSINHGHVRDLRGSALCNRRLSLLTEQSLSLLRHIPISSEVHQYSHVRATLLLPLRAYRHSCAVTMIACTTESAADTTGIAVVTFSLSSS